MLCNMEWNCSAIKKEIFRGNKKPGAKCSGFFVDAKAM